MRDRLDHLFQHCADLGINVEWDDLGEYRRGEYRRAGHVVRLNLRLTHAQAVATLAHEIGHAKFGDTCSSPKNERRAWEYAAAMVINPAEYREAEEQVGHHVSALALELGVTPKLIQAWRRWWETKGRRMEAGRRVSRSTSESS